MSGTMQTSALVTPSTGATLRALQKAESHSQLFLSFSERKGSLTQHTLTSNHTGVVMWFCWNISTDTSIKMLNASPKMCQLPVLARGRRPRGACSTSTRLVLSQSFLEPQTGGGWTLPLQE